MQGPRRERAVLDTLPGYEAVSMPGYSGHPRTGRRRSREGWKRR